MQVSAINSESNNGYKLSGTFIYPNRLKEPIADTSFNSLTPYISKKTSSADKLPMVFDSVNQWKNFCHQRILGSKLDVIA